jgi:hypothetical protein
MSKKIVQEHIKKIIHHEQMGLISWSPGWCNTKNQIE